MKLPVAAGLVFGAWVLFNLAWTRWAPKPLEARRSPAPSSAPETLIPFPLQVAEQDGSFEMGRVSIGVSSPELDEVARQLATSIGEATGEIPSVEAGASAVGCDIQLRLSAEEPELGEEGYRLEVSSGHIVATARRPAGVFYATKTLEQLLPANCHAAMGSSCRVGAVSIADRPRFAHRGAMLDVARHFFDVEVVERLIDHLAFYKFNRLHLHLTDDQGWRLMIRSWPLLATVGGNSAVGGDRGGYYTQAQYVALVEYARRRYITVIPEIELPGHAHAALVAYPQLGAEGPPPAPYTGVDVGLPGLAIGRARTTRFVDDVLTEVAALTPGPYVHVGGDEVSGIDDASYAAFMGHVQAKLNTLGKQMIGWEEVAKADLAPGSVVQHWHGPLAQRAAQRGSRVIMSTAKYAYLNMQYTWWFMGLGARWAGYIDVDRAYGWEPSADVPGVPDDAILGVEAPLWTETIRSARDLDYMAFPRLLCHAETGWTVKERKDWWSFSRRLSAQAPRLAMSGIEFYRSSKIEWPP